MSIAGTSHQTGRSSSWRTAAAPAASSVTGTSEAISPWVSAASPSFFSRSSMWRRRPGIGDSVAKSRDVGQVARELLGDPLDQEVAEADAGQPLLAVGDRIEDRRVGALGVARLGLGVEQALHVAGQAVDQRDLDEDQRLVRHARMEEGEAAPVRNRGGS